MGRQMQPRRRLRCVEGFRRSLILVVGLWLAGALAIPRVLADTPTTEPLAEVNGEAITAAEIERALGAKLVQAGGADLHVEARAARESHRAAPARPGSGQTRNVRHGLDGRGDHSKVGLVTEQEVRNLLPGEQGPPERRRDRGSVTTSGPICNNRSSSFAGSGLSHRFAPNRRLVVRIQLPVVRVAVSTEGAPIRGAAEGARDARGVL